MNAVISGQSGVAVLVDGPWLISLHAGSDAAPVDRSPGEVRFLLGDAQDLEFLEGIELEEARHRLEFATSCYDALHLALLLLDRELSYDTRRTAAEELDELLAEDGITSWVERVLYAQPLPKSGDLVGARSACIDRNKRTLVFLERLRILQTEIAEVHSAWQGIPEHCFGTDQERQHVLSIAVREGLFLDLVGLRATGRSVDDFVTQSLMKPGLGEANRHALEEWIARFDSPEEVVAPKPISLAYAAEEGSEDLWGNAPDTPENLFRRYYRPVVSFFARRGFSIEDSRDLTQETFLRVYKGMDSFRGESAVETWLFQIASNLYKNTLRSLSTQKRDAQEVSLERAEAVAELGSRQSNLTEEEVQLLRIAVEDLPPQMRQVMFLRVEGNLKYREIAEVMHVSIETVKAHLYQAKKQLRDRVANYFTDVEDL